MLGSPDRLLVSSSTLVLARLSLFNIINVRTNGKHGVRTVYGPPTLYPGPRTRTRKLMFIHRFLVILVMASLTGPRTEECISPVLEKLRRGFKHHFVVAYSLGRKQEIARAREMVTFLRSCHICCYAYYVIMLTLIPSISHRKIAFTQ